RNSSVEMSAAARVDISAVDQQEVLRRTSVVFVDLQKLTFALGRDADHFHQLALEGADLALSRRSLSLHAARQAYAPTSLRALSALAEKDARGQGTLPPLARMDRAPGPALPRPGGDAQPDNPRLARRWRLAALGQWVRR